LGLKKTRLIERGEERENEKKKKGEREANAKKERPKERDLRPPTD